MAEAPDSSPGKCEFESHRRYMSLGRPPGEVPNPSGGTKPRQPKPPSGPKR